MATLFLSKADSVLNSAGRVRAGGKVFFYDSGTATPHTAYSDDTLVTPYNNPTVLDSAGRPPVNLYLAAVDYKVIVTNGDGTDSVTIDPVHGAPGSSSITGLTTLAHGGALTSTGGILIKGDLQDFSSWSAPLTGVFRTDFPLEVQNITTANHVGISMGNNFPTTQEAGVTSYSYLSDGAAHQIYAMFAGFTSTANTVSDSDRNNSTANSTTYVGWHLNGRVGSADNDVTPLVLFSNHSAIALPGATSGLPWHKNPPAVSWWDNYSNEIVRGTFFAGTSGIGTVANLSLGSPTMSGLSITPTTAGISTGMQVSGPGVPPGTTVSAFDATTITMSKNAISNQVAQAYQTVTYTPHSGFTFEHQGGNARLGGATWGGAAVEIGTSGGVPFLQSYNQNTAAAAAMTSLFSTWTQTGQVILTPPASIIAMKITRATGQSSISGTDNSLGVIIDGSQTSGPLLLQAVSSGDIQICAGNGTVQLKGTGTVAANGSVATALSSVGPAGSHTTVQEWGVIKNTSGTLRYFPLF